ncbi:MAG: hypothetical protein CVT80_05230 [Alphaproteobacteria bacterium HGW-Alphaproteobacteria-2]|nr:MAG: hypothetical protein CVT80_05230 [Alphaproteobacteria bacterium HGW-Alphaproteobacteria-2]
MQIAYHLGAHVTDEAQIFKCLALNAQRFADQGVALPGPGRFRAVLAEALKAQASGDWNAETKGALIDALADMDRVERLVLSVDSLLCPAGQVLQDGVLYPDAGARIARLAALFDGDEVEFLLALRCPATFLPALHQRIGRGSFSQLLAEVDPLTLRWSECVARMVQAVPGARFTLWCNEDTPLVWLQVLRAVGGCGPGFTLEGSDEFFAGLMTAEGIRRLRAYIAQHPPRDEAQHMRIVWAFLDKFAREDAIEMEIGHTGWSESYVAALTEIYEEDVARIQAMPRVRFIAP